jgi:hypothetical protein
MRSGGDPAIPARIDRRGDGLDLQTPVQKSCHNAIRCFLHPWHRLPAKSAAFFGSCLSLSQALSIAYPRLVYYNSMSVKPWGRARGDAYGRRR